MIDELNDADRLKNDFISTISHELRTPLTSIKGWGETLMQVGDTDPALTKRGMSVIISEASRLSGMVEELLDFSKIQSNRMNLQLKKIDVLAELDETGVHIQRARNKRGHRNNIQRPRAARADGGGRRQNTPGVHQYF
mgnify:CR=1 FL=1